MTIHPKAIAEFIDRTRDSHEWIKKVPSKELNRELEALGFVSTSDKPFRKHQKACFLLGIAYPAFAFWLDMGLGKSRLALELLRYWRDKKEIKSGLILAKSGSAVIDWENEIKKWDIGIPFIALGKSSSDEKWESIDEFDEGLIITTYGGLTRMLAKLQQKQKTVNGKLVIDPNKKELAPNPKKIRRLGELIQAVVLDEATVVANKSSVVSRLIRQLSKHTKCFYELAGMPFGRDPEMLWHQLFMIDGGETCGETLGLFRAAFYSQQKNKHSKSKWGFDFKFKKSMEPELFRILKHRSITYDEAECLDLPRVVRKIEEVRLPDEAKAYYERFVKQVKLRNASFEERKSAFIRMRQVSSGYVGFTDDDTGERAELDFAVNPKLDRLLELIEQVPEGRKFVIWHEFIHSGRKISAALKELKIKHDWLWGGSKDVPAIRDRFDNDDSCRGLVASHKLAAYSLNLQRANFEFVYEAPISPIDNAQMRKRIPRQGQKRTVFSYDLICRGTADSRILAFHKEGAGLFKALIRDPGIL